MKAGDTRTKDRLQQAAIVTRGAMKAKDTNATARSGAGKMTLGEDGREEYEALTPSPICLNRGPAGRSPRLLASPTHPLLHESPSQHQDFPSLPSSQWG